MKKTFILTVLMTLMFSVPASAYYAIDGSLTDWGIDVSNPGSWTKGYFDTNTPTGGNDIDYVTEDNADINSGKFWVNPGWTTGNRYDAEALYMDNDQQSLYFALVTGTPPAGVKYPAGDIFFDLGLYQNPNSSEYNIKKYEYAIDILEGKLYRAQSWEDVVYSQHMASTPWKIGDTRVLLGDIDFVFADKVNSHHVVEARIPISYLGDFDDGDHIWSSWTMLCGNDHLKLKGDYNTVVPEPATMALFASGLAGGFIRRKFLG